MWGNIMDNEIGDFLNIFQLNEILIVTEKDSTIKDFTKKFMLVNMFMEFNPDAIPSNLHIVFSAWDKDFKVDNPFNFPVTYVNFVKHPERNADIPKFAIPCVGDCKSCKSCWSLTNGQSVVFNFH